MPISSCVGGVIQWSTVNLPGTTHLKKTESPILGTVNCLQLQSYGWNIISPSPLYVRVKIGFICGRSWAGNKSFYQSFRECYTPVLSKRWFALEVFSLWLSQSHCLLLIQSQSLCCVGGWHRGPICALSYTQLTDLLIIFWEVVRFCVNNCLQCKGTSLMKSESHINLNL